MGIALKWQDELIALAWINIALIVMSLPLFSIYIVGSLEGESPENFMIHTQRGHHFVEIIAKYIASILFWIPMSILLKLGATKPSFVMLKTCATGTLVFLFLLALQLIVEAPESVMTVSAYAICFVYLMSMLWIIKCFAEELGVEKEDIEPALNNTLNCDTLSNANAETFDELNDVADRRTVFRMQPLSKCSSSSNE